jgi:hypothetical protein
MDISMKLCARHLSIQLQAYSCHSFLNKQWSECVWLFNFEPWLAVTSILLPCDVDFRTKRFSRRNSPPPGSRPPHSGFCLSPFQSQTCKVLKNNVILIWAHDAITENRELFLHFILYSWVEFLQYINLSVWSNILSVSEMYIVCHIHRYNGYMLIR